MCCVPDVLIIRSWFVAWSYCCADALAERSSLARTLRFLRDCKVAVLWYTGRHGGYDDHDGHDGYGGNGGHGGRRTGRRDKTDI